MKMKPTYAVILAMVFLSCFASAQLLDDLKEPDELAQTLSAMPTGADLAGRKYSYPDSATLSEYAKQIDDMLWAYEAIDADKASAQGQRDLFLVSPHRVISVNALKRGRSGQITYLGADKRFIVVSFDLFKRYADSLLVVSEVPTYYRWFDYSELWLISRATLRMWMIERTEGPFSEARFTDLQLFVKMGQEGTAELYLSRFR